MGVPELRVPDLGAAGEARAVRWATMMSSRFDAALESDRFVVWNAG